MSTATFNYNAATIFGTTPWVSTSTFGGVPCENTNAGCGQFRFDFYGEQLEIQMIAGSANPYTVQIDGGSLTTPTIAAGTVAYYTLVSGASLGWHTVVLRATTAAVHPSVTNTFRVTASDNNPQTRLTAGYAEWVPLASTGTLSDGKATVANQFSYSTSQKVAGGYRADRFRAKTSKIPVYFVSGGADCYGALYIDGVLQGASVMTNPTTSGGFFDFVDLAALVGATLDPTAFHDYEVVYASTGLTVFSIVAGYAMSVSHDSSASYTARAKDGYIGDSIVAGFLLADPFKAWPHLASRARGAIAVAIGKNGSQEVVDGATNAATLNAWAPFDNIWNEYGTNDMSTIGTSTPSSGFATADIATLNALLTAAPSGRVLRLGILPRSSYSSTVRGNWNGTGANAIQTNIAGCNAPARVTYVDPLSVGMVDPTDYAETSPTERLHPNAAGSVKLAAIAAAAMSPVAITTGMFFAA